MRLIFAAAFAALLLAPTTADAGPLGRIWQRLQDRRTPPAPSKPSPGWVVPESGPRVVGDPMPAGVAGAELKLRQRILLDVMRHRAVEKAVKDGIPLPGGGVKKVTREEAEKLAARVHDNDILDAARVYGAPDGGRLEAFLLWLWENREAIVKFILTIMALFQSSE